MSLSPGDRYLGHGDQDTKKADAAVVAGQWLVPTGNDTVNLSDANASGGSLVAVAGMDADAGATLQVHYRGVVKARVASSVAAGDELAAPNSGGTSPTTAGEAQPGGSSGVFALTDAALDGDGNYYSFVLLR